MKPPPPRLPACGCTTASAKPVATAASIALPPSFMISTPASEANALLLATMPCCRMYRRELAASGHGRRGQRLPDRSGRDQNQQGKDWGSCLHCAPSAASITETALRVGLAGPVQL